jgi:hypothetical protein
VPVDPAHRVEHEGGQHVEHVVVVDAVVPVRAVDPAQGGAPALGVVAVRGELTHQDRGVVVPALRPARELAGGHQQLGDARDRERAQQRELERAAVVPGELDAGRQPVDLDVVALTVEGADVAGAGPPTVPAGHAVSGGS